MDGGNFPGFPPPPLSLPHLIAHIPAHASPHLLRTHSRGPRRELAGSPDSRPLGRLGHGLHGILTSVTPRSNVGSDPFFGRRRSWRGDKVTYKHLNNFYRYPLYDYTGGPTPMVSAPYR